MTVDARERGAPQEIGETAVPLKSIVMLLGLLAGGTMSLAYTMGARLAPTERSGLTLSVLASCGMLGGAISPILAGFIGQYSLRVVFFATAAAYLIAVGLAAFPSLRRRGAAQPEAAAEADA